MGVLIVDKEDPVAALVSNFPELRPAYDRLLDDWNDPADPPGSYIVFGSIFTLFIEMLLVEDASPRRDATLQRTFAFTEQLLGSTDDDLANLAYIEVLEWKAGWYYKRALPFLGPRAEAELDKYFPEWRTHESKSDGHVSSADRERLRSGDPWDVGGIVRDVLGGAA